MSAAISGADIAACSPRMSLCLYGLRLILWPFAKIYSVFNEVARPIRRQQPFPHISMKRGMRPFEHSWYETVLDWIEMDVIDVSGEIAFVKNSVLPESPLPKREVSIRSATTSAPVSIKAELK